MEHGYDGMRSMEARMSALEKRLANVSADVFHLKNSMDANTCALQEYIDLSKNFKLIMKMTGYIERASVWIAKVTLAIGLIWASWKFLVLEAIEQSRK